MEIEDYQHFNMRRQFGGVYLHFCEVGRGLSMSSKTRLSGSPPKLRLLELIILDFAILLDDLAAVIEHDPRLGVDLPIDFSARCC